MSKLTVKLDRWLATEPSRPAPKSAASQRLTLSCLELKREAQESLGALNYGRALRAYTQLIELEPWSPVHWLRLGDCLAQLDRIEEALIAYRWVRDQYRADGRERRAESMERLIAQVDPFYDEDFELSIDGPITFTFPTDDSARVPQEEPVGFLARVLRLLR